MDFNSSISTEPARMVFVFGSNREGVHGKGAALHARQWCGAISGVGEGRRGNSYAIPTKASPYVPLSLADISRHVDRFLEHAGKASSDTFMVTRVGCGLAGFGDDEIAPLFNDAPRNCILPGVWYRRRQPGYARLVVAGGRDFPVGLVKDALSHIERMTARLREQSTDFSEVCGMQTGGDAVGRLWADLAGINVVRFPADWDTYGKSAGPVRNAWMAWYGTHLLALWDGASRGTANMIAVAKAGCLTLSSRPYLYGKSNLLPNERSKFIYRLQDNPKSLFASLSTIEVGDGGPAPLPHRPA